MTNLRKITLTTLAIVLGALPNPKAAKAQDGCPATFSFFNTCASGGMDWTCYFEYPNPNNGDYAFYHCVPFHQTGYCTPFTAEFNCQLLY